MAARRLRRGVLLVIAVLYLVHLTWPLIDSCRLPGSELQIELRGGSSGPCIVYQYYTHEYYGGSLHYHTSYVERVIRIIPLPTGDDLHGGY